MHRFCKTFQIKLVMMRVQELEEWKTEGKKKKSSVENHPNGALDTGGLPSSSWRTHDVTMRGVTKSTGCQSMSTSASRFSACYHRDVFPWQTDTFLGQNCSGGVRMGGGAEHGVPSQPSPRLHFMVHELLTPLTPSHNQVSPHSARQAILQLRIYSFSCWLKRLVSTR